MTDVAIVLVLIAALAHAWWNFLAKRGTTPELFTWWMAVVGNVVMAPLAIFLFLRDAPDLVGWAFILATWILHAAYFVSLSRSYSRTDLSIAYPIARGLGVMLIPALAFAWPGLKESISAIAILGVALILLGIFTLTWWGRVRELLGAPGKLLRDRGVRYAVATGLIIAVYSVLDKQGVQHVTPLLYMYFVISSGTIGMLPFLRPSYRWQAFAAEWRAHRLSIASGGILQFAAYGMVLTALSLPDVNVSYVGPFREIAIVFGVVLGTLVLREPFARGRMLGAAMIAGGALTIALAP